MLTLNDEEKKQIEQSVSAIRRVLRKHDTDISSIVGLISKHDVRTTSKAVTVRFAEELAAHAAMNMVAFD
jgi:3-deoxy-D-arabino-heptulosonate 7-phosphate (DAHP) synthase